MLRRTLVPAGVALLAWLGASAVVAWAGQDPPAPTPTPAKEAAAKEAPAKPETPPVCADCHDLVPAFAGNPHARKDGKVLRSDAVELACVSCHGDGAAHMEAGGDKELIKVLRGAAATDTCLSCHQDTAENVSHRAGFHARGSEVNCLTCHSIHAAEKTSRKLLVKPSLELCASCHPGQASEIRGKPFAHRLRNNVMDCATCHEPHARAGKDNNLRLTRSGDIACLGCHTELKGPFVFPHVNGVTGDCMSCHQPHGSANNKQLTRATADGLCLECHSSTGGNQLGSQPPSFHNLLTARYRNCTTCHVAVHGSNRSPALLK